MASGDDESRSRPEAKERAGVEAAFVARTCRRGRARRVQRGTRLRAVAGDAGRRDHDRDELRDFEARSSEAEGERATGSGSAGEIASERANVDDIAERRRQRAVALPEDEPIDEIAARERVIRDFHALPTRTQLAFFEHVRDFLDLPFGATKAGMKPVRGVSP